MKNQDLYSKTATVEEHTGSACNSKPFVPYTTVRETVGRRVFVSSSGVLRGNHVSPNAWSYTSERIRYLNGTIRREGPTTRTVATGALSTWTQLSTPMLLHSNAPAEVYNQALSKLNELTRGSVDLSVDIAQAGQTARMFRASNKLVDFVRSLSRGRLVRGMINQTSSTWLEFQYGWKPLLSTIYDGFDQLGNTLINATSSVTVSHSAPVQRTGKANVTTASLLYQQPAGAWENHGRYVCKIGIRLKNEQLSLLNWTSLNPVSIAWELMPYSFVVDWFLNVGDYIRNMETALLLGNRYENGYVSEGTFYDGTWRLLTEDVPMGCRALTGYQQADFQYRYRWFRRKLLTSYPLPRLPTFTADLGRTRLLNAAALLAQLIKK